jgi:putative membrane protein
MDNTHNPQKQKGFPVLRDHLAAHRTDLANDRTFLAYIRTALTFFVVGITFIKFFNNIVIEIIGLIFIPVGIFILIKGSIRYRKIKRVIQKEEKNPPKVSDI